MNEHPVFVGIGGNLPHPTYGPPVAVMEAAIGELASAGIAVRRRSGWYWTSPVPPSDQPAFVNGVLDVATTLGPERLLAALHDLEARFGRVRSAPNAARVLDLDLLAFGLRISERPHGLILPHPRLHLRAFVLVPLADLSPDWQHPVLGRSVRELLAALPADQQVSSLPAVAAAPGHDLSGPDGRA
jgi:2-amino-4-hydroxy-6-hydroxymethyldihydropteridine diphosphokinase